MRIGFSSMALEQDTLFKHGHKYTTERALFDGMLDWARQTLEFGERNEFEFAELILESPIVDNEYNFAEFRDLIESFKIPINFHAPFINNNIIDYDFQLRDGSVREYEVTIDFINTLRNPPACVTVHPGHMSSFLTPIYGGVRAIYFQQALARLAAKSWPETASICFESLPINSNFFNKIDDIAPLVNDASFSKFCLTLDTSHLWICEDMAGFEPYFETFGNRIKNMHFVDNNVKNNDPHIPVGKGIIDFEEIARCMKEYKYDGDVVVEHGEPDDALATRDYLRSILY
jgi:sugar phosphate isomerase/epimerase